MNNKKTKTHKTKTHKTKTHKTKTHKKIKGGADFFGGLISVPEKKNYSVPGERTAQLLNPNLYLSIKKKNNKNSQKLQIVFNRGAGDAIDISQVPDNTTIYSDIIRKEPYLYIESLNKFLIVMYKEVLKNFEKIKLLYWLMGYNNYNIKPIFNYIQPVIPVGTNADFTIKIYKLPNNIDLNDIKNKINANIAVNHNNLYNEIILNKAYNILFDTYLKPYNLLPITKINFKVKGSSNQVIDIFSMLDKKPTQHQHMKMAKLA